MRILNLLAWTASISLANAAATGMKNGRRRLERRQEAVSSADQSADKFEGQVCGLKGEQ